MHGAARIRRQLSTVLVLIPVAGLMLPGCGDEPQQPNTLLGAEATRTPPREADVLEQQERATETPPPMATNTPKPPSPTATATATTAPPTATRPAPTATATRVAPTPNPPTATTRPAAANCHASYPDFCIPPPPPDLDCGDIGRKRVTVLPPDPHRFDADNDGIGCES